MSVTIRDHSISVVAITYFFVANIRCFDVDLGFYSAYVNLIKFDWATEL